MLESNQCPGTPRDKQLRLKLLRSQMGIGVLHHISKFCMKSPTDRQSLGSASLQDCVQWLRAKGAEHPKSGIPCTAPSQPASAPGEENTQLLLCLCPPSSHRHSQVTGLHSQGLFFMVCNICTSADYHAFFQIKEMEMISLTL